MSIQAAVQPPRFEPAQELRLALVLYGGVSLAIYINGVVQELFNLIRATAPERPMGSDPEPERVGALTEAELDGTPGVYRDLGRLLRWDEAPPRDFDDTDDPVVRTRFVLDIISGTSAGGINGVFLGKALANQQEVEGLKQLWIDEGDILRLINDKASVKGLRKLPLQKPPQSVLNSERFYVKALEALSRMKPDLERDSRYVDELDLWITATDLPGLAQPIKLFDRVVWESRHRNVFHFAYWNAYATGDGRNDFVHANDPFLAFAARCTSSFPIAFQPMTLKDIDDPVATFPQEYPPMSSDSDSPAWEAFFDDYVRQNAFYRERAFADGGYLDNKPFTYATRALLRRRADLPVDRKLIYIEPDPGHPEAEYVSKRVPDALHNLQAVYTLPRAETIREDLDALLERNRLIRSRQAAANALEIAPEDELIERRTRPQQLGNWLATDLRGLTAEWGPAYAVYFRLKVRRVIDDLGNGITRGTGFNEGSDEELAISALEQAWVEAHYAENLDGRTLVPTQNRFLFEFDLGYRMRRLNFVQDRIDELLRFDTRAETILGHVAGAELPQDDASRAEMRRELLAVKKALSDVQVRLRTVGRRLRAKGWLLEVAGPVEANWVTLAELEIVLEGPRARGVADDPRAMRQRAAQVVKDGSPADRALAKIHKKLKRSLGRAFRDAAANCDTALPSAEVAGPAGPALRALRHYYDHYESYDMAILPLAEQDAGEADVVEVIRIAPEDATSLVDESKGRHKLGGVAVGHFGGFFDRAWRRNDIMWGRLDGAERILGALLSPQHDLYPELLERAQIAIIREELAADSSGDVTAILVQSLLEHRTGSAAEKALESRLEEQQGDVRNALEAALAAALGPEGLREFLATDFNVDRRLDPSTGLRALGRGSRVLGQMLDAMPGNPALKRPAAWTIRFGSVLWGMVELATPGTWWRTGFRYWLSAVLAIALALILVGIFFGVPGAQKTGWILVALSAALVVAKGVISDVVAGTMRVRVLLVGAALVVAVAFAVLELRHIGDDASALWDWVH